MKSNGLNGLLLAIFAALWLSAGSDVGAGSGIAPMLHVAIGLVYPIAVLIVIGQLCLHGQINAGARALRISYVLVLATSAVGALAWGGGLPHVIALHYWCALVSILPIVVALLLTLGRRAQRPPMARP